MKKISYILFLFIAYCTLLIVNCYSQVSQQWVARYHFYSEDETTAIALDNAGNVYVTGRSDAFTPNGAKPDYATLKYNSAGVQQWVMRYNGPGNDFDAPGDIGVDKSGNVYVTGTSNRIPFPGQPNYDIATIKYSTGGIQQWVRRYGGESNEAASAGIVLDVQGNVYVGGRNAGIGYLIIKYDTNGDTLWSRTYSNNGTGAEAMAVDSLGNIFLTGRNSNFDWLTVKFNSQGVFQWAQIYSGPGGGADYPEAIAVSDSGNVYVTGSVWGNNDGDYATVKYNSSGVQQWVRYYNGGSIQTAHDGATSIDLDDSGNAYVTGSSMNPIVPTNDWATIKYSSSGVQLWVTRFNGPANSYDLPCCIKLDDSGNVYVTGYTTITEIPINTDYCTIKYDNSGVQKWEVFYNGTGNSIDGPTSMAIGNSDNVYVTGYSRGPGNRDYATVKYTQTTGIIQISNEIPGDFKLFQNYPNPFNSNSKIKFQIPARSAEGSKLSEIKLLIFDILGREILTLLNETLSPGTYEIDFDASNYSSGIYYYKLVMEGYMDTKKMVLIK